MGLGIFFTPSVVAVVYAYFKGKGNVKDGLSRMLTVRSWHSLAGHIRGLLHEHRDTYF